MSISRKNWSALSSLAHQWSREDEEEVERERRRRVRSSSSTADQDDDFSQTPRDTPISHSSTSGTEPIREMSQGLNSSEQMQLDFVEMVRVRDEKRRMRHMETLRRQKEFDDNEGGFNGGGGGERARVELLGDVMDDHGIEMHSGKVTSKPEPPQKPAKPYCPTSNSSSSISTDKQENRESSGMDHKPARKFVSSVSISLDSGCRTPVSPCSPTASETPQEHCPSPRHSPSPRGAQSPTQNGHTQENCFSSTGNFEETPKPAFVKHSSRTESFRMMRKKEEEKMPLQRSASVRMASKKFEPNKEQNEDDDRASTFQRNTRQRISSRSIQEKMERLAQAAQKSELMRSPDVTQRTLLLLDEVSRKRGLFEKEQQPVSPTNPGLSKQEFRGFSSGMSDRINRWLNKTNQTGSSHNPADLRHVDITSKRSVFESSGDDRVLKSSSGSISK